MAGTVMHKSLHMDAIRVTRHSVQCESFYSVCRCVYYIGVHMYMAMNIIFIRYSLKTGFLLRSSLRSCKS
jgi:hypothetical protein